MPWKRLITITISLALAACSLSTPRPDTATSEPRIGIEPIDLATLPEKLPPPEPAAVPEPQQEPAVPEYADIWSRIRDNMHLQHHTDKYSVKSRLNWYIRHPEYLDRVADRATPYLYYIIQQLDKRNMPMELALLPVVESAYQPFAYSPSHASGLWQFIPGTGRLYGLKQNWWYDGRRDIIAATQAALDYLDKLHEDFDGNWLLALAAYNSGELNVTRAIRRNKRIGKSTDFWSLHLPRETRGYVPSLLAVAELVARPDHYDVALKPVPNQPYFAKVDVGGQLDLALAAKMSGLSMDDMYTLNPGFNRWATDPDGPHYLLLPYDKKDDFEAQLASLPKNERVSWKRHVIDRGETLGKIAEQYHTSIATIKQVNDLHGNLIHTGHSLLIPSSKMPLKHYSLSLDNRRYRGLKRIGSGEKYLYTVRRGDTLWDIGRHYGVSIRNLCAWNGIPSRRYLRPGQKLTLWLAENGKNADTSDNSNEVAEVADQTVDESGVISYTVKSGDSLWLISRRFSVTVAQLVKWNGISPRRFLRPGQKLTLWLVENDENTDATDNSTEVAQVADHTVDESGVINYTVKPGDSLWLISRRFGVTVAQLVKWNNISRKSRLMPGQELILLNAPALATGA
jgi:membrane-bound lytic murein transglycosylase D